MQEPRACDYSNALVLARYLQGTRQYGVLLQVEQGTTPESAWNIDVYDDADWAGCPDTRRSTTGETAQVCG